MSVRVIGKHINRLYKVKKGSKNKEKWFGKESSHSKSKQPSVTVIFVSFLGVLCVFLMLLHCISLFATAG